MRFNQICEFLDRENWEYDPNADEQWLVLQRKGLRIAIAVDEHGEFIRFVVPELLRIAGDEPHGQAALQSLLHLGWRSKLARWQRDPADGEVRLQVDLPIEDSELSARQFWRILHGTVTLAQQGREQVRQVLATGEAGARDAGEKIRLAARSGLLSLLLQAQMSGGAESVNRELDRRGGQLDPDLADDARHMLEVVAASEGRELQERLAGAIGNIAICLQDYPRGGREQNLRMAIRLYHLILEAYPHNRAPLEWATTQNNLGNAYSKLPTGDRGENLERAIACYEQALTVWTEDRAPLDWATTQNNLGTAYSDLPTGDRGENLERAIACYEQALTVRTADRAPLEWATTQNNLGNAYSKLPTGDRGENLERAIACYEQALTVRTADRAPLDWATTQNNLGNAYSDLPTGDRGENLERAIACYEQALTVWTADRAPLDWATTQNNLGNAYSKLPTGDRGENLERAIACYEQALTVRTADRAPLDWATTQNNLGNAYSDLPTGDRGENLERAIACYEQALTVRTADRAPLDWAMTQNNLGTAYSKLPTGDRGENLERAIACYEQALTVWTAELFPLECLRTARNWGNLAFKEGDWQQALTQYGRAIAAIEGSRRSAVSEERRQQIVAESISVYENAIQAAINLNDFATALEIVERVRAKRLVDLMATADLYADGEIPPQVRDRLQQLDNLDRQIAQCRAEHQQQQQEGKASPSSPEDPVEASPTEPTHPNSGGATTAKQPKGSVLRSRQRAAISAATAEIEQLERQKQAILDELSRIDEVVAKLQQVQPPQLQDFERLRAEKTALLNFYTTDDHTHILILRPGSDRPECFTCRGQGYRNLQQWLRTTWAIPYLNKKNRWRRHMPETLAELARRLELDRLIEEYLQGIEELVVVPHLFLHQIPFAAVPISGEERYLGDRFRLRYAPSLQVLNFCHRREPLSLPQYGTVENTTDDLLFSSFEGETVCQLFDVDPTRRLIGSQATVTAYRQLLAQTHRLVSSHHAQSRTDNPLESGLRLSDGTITVSQLFAPGWRFPQLEEVYLSCCETGLFVPNSAVDEPVALSTGFLCAGARGVIASQWSIYDFSSALLSSLYHEQRKAGLNRLQALQSAQRHLREMSGQAFEEQYGEPLREFLEAEQNRIADLPNHDPKQLMEIGNAAKLIDKFGAEERPFEHPCHWAGLACYGLG
ncbi:CHAT domain-containing protein [Oxynema aestuarii]|uniref:Tetratricopeptide repeat protein n=1 Tax=Oxynema aestuarii AP17 TaxID=2064643 RepID=A0A6H1TRR9_9CYAN|nr:CHAT domain-containing protein [Oxynema aestuarii]QIZ69298.1 tetratricopeptide repeat protein [Oxynema aestuarii AP17]